MQSVYATNVFGAMLVARESARHFISRNGGNIVNVASTAGSRGYAGGTAYSSSKFASMLELHDRGFVTDATVWATNPE